MVAVMNMDELQAERRRDYRTAEWYLLRFDDERKKYEAEKAEWMSRPADDNARRHGSIGSPTEHEAILSMQFDASSAAAGWLKAVDIVIRGLCDDKRLLVTLRRGALEANGGRSPGRRAWVIYVQVRFERAVGRSISERTVRRWNADVIWRVVDAHLRLQQRQRRISEGE